MLQGKVLYHEMMVHLGHDAGSEKKGRLDERRVKNVGDDVANKRLLVVIKEKKKKRAWFDVVFQCNGERYILVVSDDGTMRPEPLHPVLQRQSLKREPPLGMLVARLAQQLKRDVRPLLHNQHRQPVENRVQS